MSVLEKISDGCNSHIVNEDDRDYDQRVESSARSVVASDPVAHQ